MKLSMKVNGNILCASIKSISLIHTMKACGDILPSDLGMYTSYCHIHLHQPSIFLTWLPLSSTLQLCLHPATS